MKDAYIKYMDTGSDENSEKRVLRRDLNDANKFVLPEALQVQDAKILLIDFAGKQDC